MLCRETRRNRRCSSSWRLKPKPESEPAQGKYGRVHATMRDGLTQTFETWCAHTLEARRNRRCANTRVICKVWGEVGWEAEATKIEVCRVWEYIVSKGNGRVIFDYEYIQSVGGTGLEYPPLPLNPLVVILAGRLYDG